MLFRSLERLDLMEYIPICALAKREEEIFVPGESKSVRLPIGSNELLLVRRIRDEAHRFAISAHRQKRSKAMTTSSLDEIAGVGPATRQRLLKVFGDIGGMKNASLKQLEVVVDKKIAKAVKEALEE